MKRKRQKIRSHRSARSQKPKRLNSEETLQFGPIRVSRFGQRLLYTSEGAGDPHKQEEFRKQLAGNYSNICDSIDAAATAAKEIIAKIDPLQLMKCAYGHFIERHMKIEVESDITADVALSLRTLEYIQATIVSVPPAGVYQDLTEDDWRVLQGHITTIYHTLQLPYFMADSARRSSLEEETEETEILRVFASMHWIGVRGARYRNFVRQHLLDFLQNQDSILVETYGIAASDLVDAIARISTALASRYLAAYSRIVEVHRTFFDGITDEELSATLPEGEVAVEGVSAAFRSLMQSRGLLEDFDQAADEAFGLGVFEVEKHACLPDSLLNSMSLGPGEAAGNGGFFDGGSHCGWPLRLFPTWNRPILKVCGKFYVFDPYSLDRVHYIVERCVRAANPGKSTEWIKNRTAVSESVPVQTLTKILPGAKVYQPVYYRWHTAGPTTKQGWCECDALVIYDDILFVLEVKAGTYTYTSPADDFEAHVNSLNALIKDPVAQGRRFIEYLRSGVEVTLCNNEHAEIGRLRHADFRRVIVCCITWEQLTHFAATLQFDPIYAQDLSGDPVWCISMDDLRVIAEVMQTPIEFVHYVQERLRAFGVEALGTPRGVDEIDHLGLYMQYNKYVDVMAKDRQRNRLTSIQPTGFQDAFDRYFNDLLQGNDTEIPRQKMPSLMAELLSKLSASYSRGRTIAGEWLLDLSEEPRRVLCDLISAEMRSQKEGRPVRLGSLVPLPLSFSVSAFGFNDALKAMLREHAAIRAIVGRNQCQVVLLIEISHDGSIGSVMAETVSLDDCLEMEMLRSKADDYRQCKVAEALRTRGHIGRNQPCPCGSPDKYKKCCMTRQRGHE